MNKTFISGNLGRDAEVKTTDAGRQYLQFSIAVEDGKDAQGNRKTIWFNCSSWNEAMINGNLKNYLKSGTKVIIVGKYVPTIWNRDIDGKTFPEISHNFLVNEIELCGSAGANNATPVAEPSSNGGAKPQPNYAGAQPQASNFGSGLSEEDDLPF